MGRQLILAIAISFLILLGWSTLVSKVYHLDNKGVTQNTPPSISSAKPSGDSLPALPPEKPISLELNFAQENIAVNFIESQAAIQSIVFKKYQDYKFVLKNGFLFVSDPADTFHKDSTSPNSIAFVHTDANKEIAKRFIFHNSKYSLELEIEIRNLSPAPLSLTTPLVLGVAEAIPAQAQPSYQDITLAGKTKISHLAPGKDVTVDEAKFVGLRDRYFCAIIGPQSSQETWTAFSKKLDSRRAEIGLQPKELTLAPGQSLKYQFLIYMGPQDLKLIGQIRPEWQQVIYYGAFDFIAQILLQLLNFFHRIVRNWGWAIIILSLAIYLILFPLMLKQLRSMKEMQALQPHIEELRKLHKDNPQRLNKELLELYKLHKVNPFGGCLPLILQIPIFFALYQVLMRSVALKGSHFLWIKDLSQPDRLITFKNAIPLLGQELNILPILMAIGMFVQQKTSMVAASKDALQQQRMMLIIFPIMFGFIFYRMPSGLVLYWFVNSALTLLNQMRMAKIK
jgi:YidC/Oxa1 family membrane protein insertase